jgi:hypothetical protein
MQHDLLVAAHLCFHFEFDVLETVFFESKSSAEEANIELMDDAKPEELQDIHREKGR